MKKFVLTVLAFLVFVTPVSAAIPKGNNFVSDVANVLSAQTEDYINSKSAQYNADGTQIVVVTVPDLEGQSIEDYAYDLFNEWGIGDEKEDKGLLIILSTGDRRIRIEVGDGMEGIFNDAKTGRMIDMLALPYLSENDYDKGIISLYDGVIEVLGDPEAYNGESGRIDYESIVSIIILILLICLYIGRGRRGGGHGGRYYRTGGWYGGFGGFGGGSSSGGGFGGFGGGSSSGGGSSRGF